MKMETHIARGENLMTRTARLNRLVVIGGTAALVATILAPITDAEMLPGAIGNDGFGAFDGSITATAHTQFDVRVPANAINGSGLDANGDHNSGNHWLGGDGPTPALPSWYIVDLGQSYSLNRVHFWNYGNGATGPTGSDRGVMTASIWLHNGAAEPNGGNADGTGGTFDSTGWTLHQFDQPFSIAPATNPFGVTDIISLGDTTARFVALDIKANHSGSGATAFTGISEMQFFTTPETPFAITNITVNPADLLEFASDDGQDYRLEFTTSPTNTTWQEAGFTIQGDGGIRLAFDPAGIDTQKTYRIIPF